MKQIDVILPVYNEVDGIRLFHDRLTDTLSRIQGYAFRIIYVLDRSTDRSFDVLIAIAQKDQRVTVLHLSRRFGHQMSLVAGLDQSRGDAAIMMDSDLQHPPELIPRLLEAFEQGFDVVQTRREYDRRVVLSKRWISSAFYALQNVLSPVDIQEGAADFRLISRKVISVFQNDIREQNQFLRGLFQWIGFQSTSVSFTSPPRVVGETKYTLSRLLAFSIAGITSFSKLPLRLAALTGVVISSMTSLYALYLLIEFIRGPRFPPGYTSLILVVLFLGGLQLIFLGILGEYLGSIFDEVKHRPLYVVDEIIGGRE